METLYVCTATPLDGNFSIIGGVVRSQTKRCSSKAKRTIGLKLEHRLALWLYVTGFEKTLRMRSARDSRNARF